MTAEMKAVVEMCKHGGGEVRLHEGVFYVRQPDTPRNEVNRVEVDFENKRITLWEVNMDDPETAAHVEATWTAAEVI